MVVHGKTETVTKIEGDADAGRERGIGSDGGREVDRWGSTEREGG